VPPQLAYLLAVILPPTSFYRYPQVYKTNLKLGLNTEEVIVQVKILLKPFSFIADSPDCVFVLDEPFRNAPSPSCETFWAQI
jgi:hypothetical protein